MHFVEVLVADATFHGQEALTYGSPAAITPGRVVVVPLRNKQVHGVVVGAVSQPDFKVKSIIGAPELSPLPAPSLALLEWMRAYYPAPMGVTTQLFLPRQLAKKPVALPTFPPLPKLGLPPLTSDQRHALGAITTTGLHILHGETGSGKTRVYIELAARCLEAGRSAVILTPEIGLTSQLAHNFRDAFGERVILVHSQLTEVTRARTWQMVLDQREPVIIIGARSALFSPLQNIGLIVVDEAHETAYKQDQAPYYHATTVAAKLASLHHAPLVLGSATPLIADYYVAGAKSRPIIRMTHTATQQTTEQQTALSVIDLRNRSEFSKSLFLSNTLIAEIKDALARNEQSLLFLNRRGTARVIFCERCGWQATCPHCDLPLVYHGDLHVMRCHSCDYKAAVPGSCPNCHNASIIFKSIGTKAVAEETQRLFPEARVKRFDTDNKKDERIELHYDAVHAGEVDIIVGTQTLAKGLDLPKLRVVGVIIADTSLYFPDFTAQERTYQLLSQVIGRVGRGHRSGSVVVQTYAPESPLLQAILEKDWGTFYNAEITERRTFRFPPFCYLLKLTCRRATSASAAKTAQSLARELAAANNRIIIEGPTPSFHEKVQNKFVWQIIVKAARRGDLTDIVRNLPSGWLYDIDPMNLL